MRTIQRKSYLLLLTLLCPVLVANAQYRTATDNIIGLDLKQVERVYQRALQRGDSSLTIKYAESLFVKSEFQRAFEMYQRADALGQIETIYQKRDFQHAALRIGKQSPYAENTGYFSNELDWIVDVSTFCANSPQEDFAPFFWRDILFITSSRGENDEKYLFTKNPFLNVHAFIHDCISANLPDALPRQINTPNHDGPIAISEDGNLFVITRNHLKESSDGIKNLYLDYYVREANSWSDSKKFPLFDTEFSVQHPFYSDSDSTLYFSSNKDGGYGGFDLYKTKWNGKSWEEPVNLGPEINSPYDEVFPAISPDGDLIYSTNHIETNGGLDLVLVQNDTRYLLPEPFNTIHDDFSIAFKDSRSGYFASNRSFQGFTDDIYTFHIQIPEYEFFVEVLDEETHKPIQGVKVDFNSIVSEGTIYTSENGTGFLHAGRKSIYEYAFNLSKDGYEPKSIVSKDFVKKDSTFVLTLFLKEIFHEGQFIVYFDNDRPDPRSTKPNTNLTYEQTFRTFMARRDYYYNNSINTRAEIDAFFEDVEQGMLQLGQLAEFLKDELSKNRHYVIAFTSHASPLASSDYNLVLSKRRFASVENFLKSWEEGALSQFINLGILNYENNPFGAALARPQVSDDRRDPARSIYSVEAAKERRVTISWRRVRSDDNSLFHKTPETNEAHNLTETHIDQKISEQTNKNHIVNESIKKNQITPKKVYHIIVGSHNSKEKAELEARSLRLRYNTNANIISRTEKGFFRISYGVYASITDAEAALSSIRLNVNPQAWILVE